MSQWAIINDADNSWVSGPVDSEPTPGDGQHLVTVPPDYPDGRRWSAALNGFVDLTAPQTLISVGRFKLLFTQSERIAMRAAAKQSHAVEDFMDLLNGFTDGVTLSDPVMTGAIGQLQAAGLLTADRAAAVLAGSSPA